MTELEQLASGCDLLALCLSSSDCGCCLVTNPLSLTSAERCNKDASTMLPLSVCTQQEEKCHSMMALELQQSNERFVHICFAATEFVAERVLQIFSTDINGNN